MTWQVPVGQFLSIVKDSQWPLGAPHSVGLLRWTDHPDAETTTWQQITLTVDTHSPGVIQTHNSSNRAAADPRLWSRGNWDPLYLINMAFCS